MQSRAVTFCRHLLSILVLPTTVTVLVPVWLLRSRPIRPSALSISIGALVIGLGLVLVASTVWHFGAVGRGTLAPWDPPRRLVVTGVYRYVRNPMISGVILILMGEAIALQSAALMRWMALFVVINATYIPLLEEQWLLDRFGDDYREYRRHVPRWVPRLTPWNDGAMRGRRP